MKPDSFPLLSVLARFLPPPERTLSVALALGVLGTSEVLSSHEHYWLSPTGTSGLPGTSGNPAPLNPSALRDHVAGVAGTSIHIHLAAGTYTNGWLGFTTISPANALATRLYIHGDTNQPPHATVLLFPSDKNWARDTYGTSV